MKRFLTACALVALLPALLEAQPLVNSFPLVLPSYDSTRSAWLPQMPAEDIDVRGFLRTLPDGHLGYGDGTRARFVGAGMIATACFPDSAAAIATANRLRKLGVNMVRFDYFDYHNFDAASTLAPGRLSDTLSPSQMKRLDWFLYQLKRNGIRAHFVVKSRNGPRRDDGVPGWDSTYNYGQYIAHFSEPMQRMQQRYMTKLFTHVNPYTGKRYADDPVIALVTISDLYTVYDNWINDRLNLRANYISFGHSRLIDTMFCNFLRGRYSTTANLRSAYWEGNRTVGPNLIANPGFESFTDNWELVVNEGAQGSTVIVQGPDVAPGNGPSSLRLAIRKVDGNEGRIYIQQRGVKVRKNGIYRLQFRAKTDSAGGRQIRISLLRGSSPFDNLGINEYPALTKDWTTFDYTFRSLATDSIGTILRVYLGKQMGDVFLDGFSFTETGREGLLAGETIETNTVARGKYRDIARMSLQRMYDQTDFYDSLARVYYRSMRDHLRSLGVKAPLAGTNNTAASADSWTQTEHDFTSETAQWDFTSTRTGMPNSDSTWVMRNYSVLRYRDQKIPEFARNARVGKPFIAESYLHVFPNAHRSESMLFLPAYASLHDWDGMYFNCYSDRSTELQDRRRVFKDDYSSIIGDPSITALLPQVSAAMRNGWIAPARRMVRIQHDTADLRYLPVTYYSRGFFQAEGNFQNVVNLVTAVRVDSFAATRHYTADDYYVTIPSDDNIQSDTREITLDMTKGILQVNTPMFQGGSGALNTASSVKTDNISMSWIEGGTSVTYLWSSLDGVALDSSRRSLLSVSTRALNTGTIWQFGDSSIGKNWGAAPTLMEGVRLGVNITTSADSVVLRPLDTFGLPTGREIIATRNTSGAFRVTLDIAAEGTPWFGVEQYFSRDTGISAVSGLAREASVGTMYPNPAMSVATVDVNVPGNGALVSARVVDMLGRTVAYVAEHWARPGTAALEIDVRSLPAGTYVCAIAVGDRTVMRQFAVVR